jgi:hypothetical protein
MPIVMLHDLLEIKGSKHSSGISEASPAHVEGLFFSLRKFLDAF